MADQQQSLNQLLQWSIENSTSESTTTSRDPKQGFDARALAELLGGPTDADRMRGAMSAIVAPISQIDLSNKMIAWDNFEQLIENLDNANNMEALGLWPPLVQQLDSPEAEMRKMAAWSISTAVQNNIKTQEKALEHSVVAKLAALVERDESRDVRKKAATALSSEVRNFQPGLDELEKSLSKELWGGRKRVDASDMDAVDDAIQRLRDHANRS